VRHYFFHEFNLFWTFSFVHNYLALGACKTWKLEKPHPAFARLRRDQPDKLIPNPKARLREQVREVMRFHHYSLRTGEAYWQWIKRFIFFQGNMFFPRRDCRTQHAGKGYKFDPEDIGKAVAEERESRA